MLRNLTIIDFETTGLHAERDRVIELAAIRVIDGIVASEFRTFIRYDGKLAPKITEITGITDDDLRTGMDEETAFRILNRLLGDSVLVAHNAAFDLGFLHHTLMRLAGRSFSNAFIDTLTISRERASFPYTLGDMCRHYGIVLEGAHRALNDVIGCWKLLEALHSESPADSYINKLGYLKKYGPPKWMPDYAVPVPQDNRYVDKQR